MNILSAAPADVTRPVRILQFGEGNFLRAFVDYMVDIANKAGVYNGNIAIVQPIDAPLFPAFAEQNCRYTVIMRGKENGKTINTSHIVTSVAEVIRAYSDYDRFMEYAALDTLEVIVSNTTEAGIVLDETDSVNDTPPNSYPGKLTQFLWKRFNHFNGAADKGLVIYPVELIENNGGKLKSCVLALAARWNLGEDFVRWLNDSCLFCSTLVDRIVTGYPKGAGEADKICQELGYEDKLLDIGEPFGLWVIEADDIERARKALPLDKAGLPVLFTDNQKPYRERKVRILNGAHTSFVPAAFLGGQKIVRDCMLDPAIRPYIDTCIYHEIMPTVNLPKDDVKRFADSVCERFENPFIDHQLISICLNSVSKWKARVLPSLLDSHKANGKYPACLLFSFAALCEFYARGKMTDHGFVGEVNGEEYTIADDAAVIDFFTANGS
ncbi:MAG: tagaturonate reductase, partial [Clostridia bacterium]|nr:tagaturonate reductase [Clostridia bacterium]